MPPHSQESPSPSRPRSRRSSDLPEDLATSRFLLDHMEDALLCIDAEGRITDLNAAAGAFFECSQDALRSQPFREAVPPSAEDTFHDRCRSVVHDGPASFEAFFPSLNRWAQTRAVPLARSATDRRGVAVYLRDITDNKQRRTRVEDKRQRLEMALMGGDLGLWDLNFNTNTNVVNDRWAEMLGYTLDEVGCSQAFFEAHVHPDDLRRAHDAMRRHARGEIPFVDLEIRMRAKDGSWRWILDRGKILEWNDDGTPRRAVGTHMDITKRKQQERALRRSEERFRAASEQAVDVVAIFDADGTFQYLSPSVESVTGFEREALVGRSGFEFVHPADRDALRAAFDTALRSPDAPVEVMGRYRHREGTWRHLSIRGRRISSQDGTPQVLANVRDVTDEKRRRTQLLAAKKKAEEVSALKSAMLANMSHEVRTPLTTVIGFADMLADLELGDTPTHVADLIQQSAHRLLDTLDGVLDLSRLEADAVDLNVTPVLLPTFLSTLTDAFQGQAQQKQVRLAVHSPPSLVLAADERALRGILNNLINNAIKFTDPGGTVEVRAAPDQNAVVLSVADTGIGMDPAFVAEAFQAFRQESTGNSREFEGSGLGLAICERYVDLLGGTIAIESEKGVGTTVTVRLPQRPTG